MSNTRWNILYRGPLSSCNYDCSYCPFAKTRNTAEELRDDAQKLGGFVEWVAMQEEREIGILFTPWGEALGHLVYREAMRELSQMPHVYRVAIQTNLSADLSWVSECDLGALAFWTTYHPTQIGIDRFVGQCARLDAAGAKYSVGVVGLREHFAEIRELRSRLAPETYLWVNAYKSEGGDYYSDSEVDQLAEIDPHFRTNNVRHPSAGKPCCAGHTSFTVDGGGDVRRCHFVDGVIGNIYGGGFPASTLDGAPAPCPNATCGCHIGYVHLLELDLYRVFGDGLLERRALAKR